MSAIAKAESNPVVVNIAAIAAVTQTTCYSDDLDDDADDCEYDEDEYEDFYGDEDYKDLYNTEKLSDVVVKTQSHWIRNQFGHGIFVGRIPKLSSGSSSSGESAFLSSRPQRWN